GREGDLFRMPLTPMTAQEIARKLDCSMITRKVSNDIYAHAAVKLEPRPLTEKREAVETLYQHNQIVEGQLQEMKAKGGDLVAGQKKDVVITPLLKNKPGKVAIYGWHKLDGKAIQPLYLGHVNWYVDYSHGIRLMSNHLVVDGKEMTVGEVLTSSTLSSLLSDEGVFVTAQYPTTQAATTRN
ncbi:MAG TPA: hypothetical protein VFE58_10840, partial [Tepidisphaeraceae bacterium]|nr:hypothetical protein [Tepidisphaeraceae bacterium]